MALTDDTEIGAAAERVLTACRAGRSRVALAESCTGGMVAAALTDIAGSSDVVDCGFVTYSNQAKIVALGVDRALIEEHGAVSEAVATAMAEGALARSHAHLAVAITGVAGPGGGSEAKPVGMVCFARARRARPTIALTCRFDADAGRAGVRRVSVLKALELLEEGAATPAASPLDDG